MNSQALGQVLRQAREAKELTLDDAERALRIRHRLLEGFELGEFIVPDLSPVQARGLIRNYAAYLGLDGDHILSQYETALVEDEQRARGGRGRSLSGRNRPPDPPPAP
ncbi:MAG: helix-turn-helix domain-containing protein, partial [Chloroflexota bacterium]|nr:helix-turn-helix domain-containing protein [Chloroflexota bacterium]